MANKTLWAAESSSTLMTTELNNLADDGMAVDGADYDNATNLYQLAAFELFCDDFDAAPDSGGYFELHLFYKLDGTNYADGYDGDADSDSETSGNTLVGIFPLSANDADQRIQIMEVPLRPFAFRAAIVNKSGTDLTAVDTHHLKIFPYNYELQ